MKKNSLIRMIGGAGHREREEHDFYATPPSTTKLFLDAHELNGDSILEPACGEGHISEVIKEYYPQAHVESSDLINRNYGIGGIDFLEGVYEEEEFDIVFTNPPFSLFSEFILKGLEVAKHQVIMFGKIQLLESKGRYKKLKDAPLKYMYVHVERQAPWKGGSPVNENGKPWGSAICYCWFVWEKGYKGEPMIRWLTKEELEDENESNKI